MLSQHPRQKDYTISVPLHPISYLDPMLDVCWARVVDGVPALKTLYHSMLDLCCVSVVDRGPMLKQHCVNAACLMEWIPGGVACSSTKWLTSLLIVPIMTSSNAVPSQ